MHQRTQKSYLQNYPGQTKEEHLHTHFLVLKSPGGCRCKCSQAAAIFVFISSCCSFYRFLFITSSFPEADNKNKPNIFHCFSCLENTIRSFLNSASRQMFLMSQCYFLALQWSMWQMYSLSSQVQNQPSYFFLKQLLYHPQNLTSTNWFIQLIYLFLESSFVLASLKTYLYPQ